MEIALFLCQIAHPNMGRGGNRGERGGGEGRSEPWLELGQGARTDALRKDSSLRLEIFKALDLFESFHGLALRVLLSYSHGWLFR